MDDRLFTPASSYYRCSLHGQGDIATDLHYHSAVDEHFACRRHHICYVIIAFTALLGIAMSCTNSQKLEIYAATATFAVVEVVTNGSDRILLQEISYSSCYHVIHHWY
jgi:hypothetical protein